MKYFIVFSVFIGLCTINCLAAASIQYVDENSNESIKDLPATNETKLSLLERILSNINYQESYYKDYKVKRSLGMDILNGFIKIRF